MTTHAATGAAAQRRGPSRALLLLLVAAALAIGGGVTAAVLLAVRSSGTTTVTQSVVAATTVVRTVKVTQSAAGGGSTKATGAPLTIGGTQRLLREYAAAYSAKNTERLGRLFAPDVAGQIGTDVIANRAQALAAYRRQFSGLANPRFTFDNMSYTSVNGDGQAAGTYVIEQAGGSERGGVTFHFVSRGGRALIDRITVAPS